MRETTAQRRVSVSELPRDADGNARLVVPPGLEIYGVSYNGIAFMPDLRWGYPVSGLGWNTFYLEKDLLPTGDAAHDLIIEFEGVPDTMFMNAPDDIITKTTTHEHWKIPELLLFCLLSKEDRGAIEAELQDAILKFGSRRAKLVYWSHVVLRLRWLLPTLMTAAAGAAVWLWTKS